MPTCDLSLSSWKKKKKRSHNFTRENGIEAKEGYWTMSKNIIHTNETKITNNCEPNICYHRPEITSSVRTNWNIIHGRLTD